MDVKIIPSPLQGKMCTVSSKMGAHRALIISALANQKTEIEINNNSEEVRATIACLKTLGAYLFNNENSIMVRPINRETMDISVIDCFNSFATLKFLLPIIATFNKTVEITGERVLQKKNLEQFLYRLKGVGFTSEKLPFILSGKLLSGEYNIPTELGAQFISGLIIALCTLDGDSTVSLIGESGLSAIHNTVELLKEFNVEIKKTESGYFIRGGQEFVSPERLTLDTDKAYNHYINLVEKLINKDFLTDDIDAKNNFDLLVCATVLALLSNGDRRITFSEKLLEKESEKICLFKDAIIKLGGMVELDNALLVSGNKKVKGGAVIDTYKDARIGMALTILSCFLEEETVLLGVENVLKNYPEFFNDLKSIGANVVTL